MVVLGGADRSPRYFSSAAQAQHQARQCDPQTIVGRWRYYKFVYEDRVHPPLSPNLVMEYEFYPNGTNRLHWTRTGEHSYCERRGMYIYRDCFLMDKITWINQKQNTRECASDPDMKVGRETITELDFQEGDLVLHLQLGDKPFQYIWQRMPEE